MNNDYRFNDERINEEMKKWCNAALNDDEASYRPIDDETKYLIKELKKIENYIENNREGSLIINSNQWYVSLDTIDDVLRMYGLELQEYDRVTEQNYVIDHTKNNKKDIVLPKSKEKDSKGER